MTRMVDDSNEAQSTKELIIKILATNRRLGDIRSNEVAVGSMDITAHYPGVDRATSAKLVKDESVEATAEN